MSLVELFIYVLLLVLLVMIVLAFMNVISFLVPLITVGVYAVLFLLFYLLCIRD